MKFGGSYFGGEVQSRGVASAVFSTVTTGNFKNGRAARWKEIQGVSEALAAAFELYFKWQYLPAAGKSF